MNVQEIRKLDAYLKKLFGNAAIRVVPKGGDEANVFSGEDEIGELTADEDEGERSYNFRMVIQLGSDPSIQPVPALTNYLRHRFGNDKLRVVTRPKQSSNWCRKSVNSGLILKIVWASMLRGSLRRCSP